MPSLETEYLNYLKNTLLEKTAELGELSPYSREDIEKITSSVESFTKAAEAESLHFWEGLSAELTKAGMSKDFVLGMKKEAGIMDLLKLWRPILSNPIKTLRSSVPSFFGSGGVDTTQKFVSNTKGVGGGLLKSRGGKPQFLSDADLLQGGRLEGARTQSFIDKMKSLGVNDPAFKNVEQDLKKKMFSSLQQNQNDLLGKHFFNLQEQAYNDPKVRKVLERIGMDAGKKTKSPTGIAAFQKHLEDSKLLPKGNKLNLSNEQAAQMIESAKQMRASKFSPGSGSYSMPTAPSAGLFRFTPDKGLLYGGLGTLGGGLVGGPLGALAGGGIGTLGGTLGLGGGALAGGGALLGGGYLGGKMLGLWGQGKDKYGAPVNRNNLLPFVNNQVAGGVGGALIGEMIARELNLPGASAYLLPLLTGYAGKEYFPYMMNRWKDPYGYGVNSMPVGAAAQNRANPLY